MIIKNEELQDPINEKSLENSIAPTEKDTPQRIKEYAQIDKDKEMKILAEIQQRQL